MTVIGWTGSFDDICPTATFTDERRRALIERIRKRKYNFNHMDHQFLPYCCPVYNDKTICVLTKPQWDTVMSEAYADTPRGARFMPQDAITRPPKKGILYEKEKFEEEGDHNNG